MLSNSCRYGIRAVMYLASRPEDKKMTGIVTISKDLNLPAPFLAKILQQLAKHKMLISLKGPHGGFSLLKDPEEITLLDIIKTIDGDDIFNNCVIHNSTCRSYVAEHKKKCALHDDYSVIRNEMVKLFSSMTIQDLVNKAGNSKGIVI
jgi:Rrf2 family protein